MDDIILYNLIQIHYTCIGLKCYKTVTIVHKELRSSRSFFFSTTKLFLLISTFYVAYLLPLAKLINYVQKLSVLILVVKY